MKITQQELQRRRDALQQIEDRDAADFWARARQKSRQATVGELKSEGDYLFAQARNAEAIGTPAHDRQLRLLRSAMASAGSAVTAYKFFEGAIDRLQGRQVGGQNEYANMFRQGRRGGIAK